MSSQHLGYVSLTARVQQFICVDPQFTCVDAIDQECVDFAVHVQSIYKIGLMHPRRRSVLVQ